MATSASISGRARDPNIPAKYGAAARSYRTAHQDDKLPMSRYDSAGLCLQAVQWSDLRKEPILRTGMPTKLNTEILAAAIVGFEEQKKRIDAHIAELRKNGAGPHSEEHPRGSHFHFFGQKRADKKSRRAGLIGAGLVEIRGGGKQ